jgi:hypothetical protein
MTRQCQCSCADAGQWRGLPVAIKTVLFQSSSGDSQMALVASEAAIASNLVHPNIVATYSHDICNVSQGGNELPIFKFYLIQVSVPPAVPVGFACYDLQLCPSTEQDLHAIHLPKAGIMEHMFSPSQMTRNVPKTKSWVPSEGSRKLRNCCERSLNPCRSGGLDCSLHCSPARG